MKENDFDLAQFSDELIQAECSRISFNTWCAQQAADYVTVPGLRVVDIYKVVRSVVENDLTDVEKTAAIRCWFEGKSAAVAARESGTSKTNVYKALSRSKEKIRLVLKHIVDCEEYRIEI